MANYSWHKEYYLKALARMARSTEAYDCSGWLPWFRETYPEQYVKFHGALQRIHELWGNMDPRAMEEFKSAVKTEIDATKWACEKYVNESPPQEVEKEAQEVPRDDRPCTIVIEFTESRPLMEVL